MSAVTVLTVLRWGWLVLGALGAGLYCWEYRDVQAHRRDLRTAWDYDPRGVRALFLRGQAWNAAGWVLLHGCIGLIGGLAVTGPGLTDVAAVRSLGGAAVFTLFVLVLNAVAVKARLTARAINRRLAADAQRAALWRVGRRGVPPDHGQGDPP